MTSLWMFFLFNLFLPLNFFESKDKEELIQQLENARADKRGLQAETEDSFHQMSIMAAERQQHMDEIEDLKNLLTAKKQEHDRIARTRHELESGMKQATDQLAKKDAEVTTKIGEVNRAKEVAARLENIVKEERMRAEREAREREAISQRAIEIVSELESTKVLCQRLRSEVDEKVMAVKNWESEVWAYREENKTMIKSREMLQKRVKTLEASKVLVESERDQFKVRPSIHYFRVHFYKNSFIIGSMANTDN